MPHTLQLVALWTLVVSCVVAWRQGVLFDGGFDLVVIIKATLQTAALVWAFLLWLWSDTRHPLGVRSLFFLSLVLSLSVLGAMADGNIMASAIIAIRILMLALTVMFIMRVCPAEQAVVGLCIALSIVGLVSAGTGIVFGAGGRLSGGIPPLSPNEIALLCGVPALVLFHQALRAQVRWFHVSMLGLLAAGLLLSESRTALIAAAFAAGMIVLLLRKIPAPTIVAALVSIPLAFYLLFLTPMVQNLMSREDSASIMTLNSRTISWSVVLSLPNDSWQRWIGAGLSVKTIAVEGQYWDEQVFDSSWISLLAQTGLVGTTVVAVWVLLTAYSALRFKKLRSLFVPLLAFIFIRSFMENGLVDAGALFLIFLVFSMSVELPVARVAHDWDNEVFLGQRTKVQTTCLREGWSASDSSPNTPSTHRN